MSVLVVLLIAAIAAATFVVSYAGVRDLAIGAGVPWRLARLYPAILDGVLVVACTAAFVLRDDTSVLRRLWAWLATAILFGVVGAADAIHAMKVNLPHRPTEGTIAALPWAVVMLGFSLWLTMLRYARAHNAAATATAAATPPVAVPPGEPPVGASPIAAAPAAVSPTAPPLVVPPAAVFRTATPTTEAAAPEGGSPESGSPGGGSPESGSPETDVPRGAVAAIGRTTFGPAPAPFDDAGLDLALGLVHDTLDDADMDDLDDSGTLDETDSSPGVDDSAAAGEPGTSRGSAATEGGVEGAVEDADGDESSADESSADETVADETDGGEGGGGDRDEAGTVEGDADEDHPDETSADRTRDETGQSDQTQGAAPAQHPKLYRVRSTPVPPAD